MSYFAKVSRKQFIEDSKKVLEFFNEEVLEKLNELYDKIQLPRRGTEASAGYDFYFPYEELTIISGKAELIPTGIRWIAYDDARQVLYMVPRSGLGFKTGVHLANTIGVIDADYCQGSNEGHIMVKMVGGFKDLELHQGERFVQGIISNYNIVNNDNPIASERTGGMGSTGK